MTANVSTSSNDITEATVRAVAQNPADAQPNRGHTGRDHADHRLTFRPPARALSHWSTR
ncbi:hypothetical protein [Nocardia lijiangensis]|uniref:hypothetical protein n=1 Tax=Nocardia lijiangensis TaxID=299618 RepID=UPI003D73D941